MLIIFSIRHRLGPFDQEISSNSDALRNRPEPVIREGLTNNRRLLKHHNPLEPLVEAPEKSSTDDDILGANPSKIVII